MTVIAWDGKTLAGDRMMVLESRRVPYTKVHRVETPNGRRLLVGVAGTIAETVDVLAWIRAGEPDARPAVKNVSILIVDEALKVWQLQEEALARIEVALPKWAVGCGGDYAMAAMECGAVAAEAIAIASKFDYRCGMGVDTVSFEAS